jgi:hypothetical protein
MSLEPLAPATSQTVLSTPPALRFSLDDVVMCVSSPSLPTAPPPKKKWHQSHTTFIKQFPEDADDMSTIEEWCSEAQRRCLQSAHLLAGLRHTGHSEKIRDMTFMNTVNELFYPWNIEPAP